jgi:hypothetical protein
MGYTYPPFFFDNTRHVFLALHKDVAQFSDLTA